jgi:acetolactate synthase-1/2/3 large subunit
VQIAHPQALIINVAAEASWLMNMQEIGTAMQSILSVKPFILNNECLGMVCQWQELPHCERYSQSWSDGAPNFVKLFETLGCRGIKCADHKHPDEAIVEVIRQRGPVVFDCLVE